MKKALKLINITALGSGEVVPIGGFSNRFMVDLNIFAGQVSDYQTE